MGKDGGEGEDGKRESKEGKGGRAKDGKRRREHPPVRSACPDLSLCPLQAEPLLSSSPDDPEAKAQHAVGEAHARVDRIPASEMEEEGKGEGDESTIRARRRSPCRSLVLSKSFPSIPPPSSLTHSPLPTLFLTPLPTFNPLPFNLSFLSNTPTSPPLSPQLLLGPELVVSWFRQDLVQEIHRRPVSIPRGVAALVVTLDAAVLLLWVLGRLPAFGGGGITCDSKRRWSSGLRERWSWRGEEGEWRTRRRRGDCKEESRSTYACARPTYA